MKIVYLSNFFNHHQSSLADNFYKATGGDYYFIETESLPEDKARLGYPKIDRPYVLNYYENRELVDRLVWEADVVIHGEAPLGIIKRRILSGKLTFHDNERRYKSLIKYLKWPIYTYNSMYLNRGYLLCASAYASRDFGLSGMASSKCFKWGYFTKVNDIDVEELISRYSLSDGPIRIMWCSRFLNCKHPELPVRLAAKLKSAGYKFQIDMYGTGKELERTKSLSRRVGVNDVVRFHGSRPNDEILKEMRSHEIFLFTSDRYEGWGAVLNEAMASGCAVVASHAIGAVPYLINDGHNGLIFKSCDVDSLKEKVISLIDDKEKRDQIRRNAYKTLATLWNADTACRNFIRLAESLLNAEDNPIAEGPCSPAPRINHHWI